MKLVVLFAGSVTKTYRNLIAGILASVFLLPPQIARSNPDDGPKPFVHTIHDDSPEEWGRAFEHLADEVAEIILRQSKTQTSSPDAEKVLARYFDARNAAHYWMGRESKHKLNVPWLSGRYPYRSPDVRGPALYFGQFALMYGNFKAYHYIGDQPERFGAFALLALLTLPIGLLQIVVAGFTTHYVFADGLPQFYYVRKFHRAFALHLAEEKFWNRLQASGISIPQTKSFQVRDLWLKQVLLRQTDIQNPDPDFVEKERLVFSKMTSELIEFLKGSHLSKEEISPIEDIHAELEESRSTPEKLTDLKTRFNDVAIILQLETLIPFFHSSLITHPEPEQILLDPFDPKAISRPKEASLFVGQDPAARWILENFGLRLENSIHRQLADLIIKAKKAGQLIAVSTSLTWMPSPALKISAHAHIEIKFKTSSDSVEISAPFLVPTKQEDWRGVLNSQTHGRFEKLLDIPSAPVADPESCPSLLKRLSRIFRKEPQ